MSKYHSFILAYHKEVCGICAVTFIWISRDYFEIKMKVYNHEVRNVRNVNYFYLVLFTSCAFGLSVGSLDWQPFSTLVGRYVLHRDTFSNIFKVVLFYSMCLSGRLGPLGLWATVVFTEDLCCRLWMILSNPFVIWQLYA